MAAWGLGGAASQTSMPSDLWRVKEAGCLGIERLAGWAVGGQRQAPPRDLPRHAWPPLAPCRLEESGGSRPPPPPVERFRADRQYTARISPYMAWGELSPRHAARHPALLAAPGSLCTALDRTPPPPARPPARPPACLPACPPNPTFPPHPTPHPTPPTPRRQVYHAAARLYGRKRSATFLRRLAWRDLAYWALWRFPWMPDAPLRPQYEHQRWDIWWRGEVETRSLQVGPRRTGAGLPAGGRSGWCRPTGRGCAVRACCERGPAPGLLARRWPSSAGGRTTRSWRRGSRAGRGSRWWTQVGRGRAAALGLL